MVLGFLAKSAGKVLFMRRLSSLLFVALLAAASFLTRHAAAAPSADVYGSPPDHQSAAISPEGKYLSIQMPLGENGGVKIIKLADGTSCGIAPSNVKVRNAFWVAPDRLAVRVSFFFTPQGAPSGPQYQYEIFRYITMNADCKGSYDVLRDHKDYGRLGGFSYVGRSGDGSFLLFAAYSLRDTFAGEFTGSRISQRDRTSLDVYKIDASTGKSERLEEGTPYTSDWIADGNGRLRIRVDQGDRGGSTVLARLGEATNWTQVYHSDPDVDEARELHFIALGSRPDVAYVVTRNGSDRDAVYEYNLAAKALGRLVFQHPKVDVDEVAVDRLGQYAVGAIYTVDYETAEYFDRAYAQMQADLVATFPGEHVNITSASNDRKKFVALVEGPQNPTGTYYLVDMTEPSVSKIGPRYQAITAADVGQVKSITYQARDGMEIPAYLTLPPGSSGKNLPLVVMPHGGPRARDTAHFDPWAQFLASRGYAVLQPNFRGSSGFGSKFLKAGRQKWGLDMQNDISDGVKHLIANGTVDASKVCIYGWSYGGYAAMAGLALTPEYYRCGVAGAGISDLLLFIGDRKRRSEAAAQYWADDIGSPISDHDRLVATSPIKQVANIKAPLLLLHPKDDTVVPLRQSSLMAEAMRAAGKQVEYIELEGDDHWLSKASTSKRVLRELEAFLAKHLK